MLEVTLNSWAMFVTIDSVGLGKQVVWAVAERMGRCEVRGPPNFPLDPHMTHRANIRLLPLYKMGRQTKAQI